MLCFSDYKSIYLNLVMLSGNINFEKFESKLQHLVADNYCKTSHMVLLFSCRSYVKLKIVIKIVKSNSRVMWIIISK